jgi:hypothetical protein
MSSQPPAHSAQSGRLPFASGAAGSPVQAFGMHIFHLHFGLCILITPQLEELVRNTPPPIYEYLDDPLDRALSEISALASNMNEGKREAESRRKLVRWQTRIRGKFPSPLVQPHRLAASHCLQIFCLMRPFSMCRKLIMDGPLLLTRVVRKAVVSFEAITAQGDSANVQVDCLAPELTPRPLIGILCNDLLVLCRDPSEGQDPSSPVDLWAVLRMQTLPQPASIVHGNALRLVDNKAILYFDAPSPSDALNWYRGQSLLPLSQDLSFCFCRKLTIPHF